MKATDNPQIVGWNLCVIGIHCRCFVCEEKVPYSYGPFDPRRDRCETKDREICGRCGKERLREQYSLSDYPGL